MVNSVIRINDTLLDLNTCMVLEFNEFPNIKPGQKPEDGKEPEYDGSVFVLKFTTHRGIQSGIKLGNEKEESLAIFNEIAEIFSNLHS